MIKDTAPKGYRTGTRVDRVQSANKRYDVLVVSKISLEISAAFDDDFVVTKEGSHLKSRLINRVFSAVPPTEKYKHWWNGLIDKAKDPKIHWL